MKTSLPYEGAIIVRDSDFVALDDKGQVQGHGGLIATFSGRVINPLDPDPTAIVIEDIAHALGNNCRFTGHVKRFYSVAEHCVRCSYIVSEELALTALLHDASEAYLSDIARPVKAQPEFGDVYKKYEGQLEEVIAAVFGLSFPFPPEIKEADTVLLRTEQRDLMPAIFRHEGTEYLDETIEPWSPEESEHRFLERYWELVSPKPRVGS